MSPTPSQPLPDLSQLPPALAQLAQQLSETTSIALVQQIRFCAIPTPLSPEPISTAYVTNRDSLQDSLKENLGLGEQGQSPQLPQMPQTLPPILMLHGFDSSLLEFRRLYPLLAESQAHSESCSESHAPAAPQAESQGEQTARREVWLVDLLGFGFSDRPRNLPYSPEALKAHLLAFWQRNINRPVTLIGASMGGAAAIDFATSHPEAVAQLILIDSAGYQNGPILGKYLFSPLDQWAVEFLRKPGVRRRISCNAYADPDRLVTPDAECCAALHLLMPRWDEALKAFTKSGGYPTLRDLLPKVAAPTLILWGQQDRILGTRDAIPLAQAIPNSTLRWIDRSGHVPHLEQPEAVAEAILGFQS